MKMSNLLYTMAIGLFLQGALLGCTSAGDMKTDEMTEANSNGMMNETRMHDNQMLASEKSEGAMTDMMAPTPTTAMLTGSSGHKAAGTVSFSSEMGKDFLVLSDIRIEKVPDGHVYLAKQGDRTHGIDLGTLRQFTGNVSFALPAMVNPAEYDSVIIYCVQYDVEIGRAKLERKM